MHIDFFTALNDIIRFHNFAIYDIHLNFIHILGHVENYSIINVMYLQTA